jgi:hypothetical protein
MTLAYENIMKNNFKQEKKFKFKKYNFSHVYKYC